MISPLALREKETTFSLSFLLVLYSLLRAQQQQPGCQGEPNTKLPHKSGFWWKTSRFNISSSGLQRYCQSFFLFSFSYLSCLYIPRRKLINPVISVLFRLSKFESNFLPLGLGISAMHAAYRKGGPIPPEFALYKFILFPLGILIN